MGFSYVKTNIICLQRNDIQDYLNVYYFTYHDMYFMDITPALKLIL